MAEHTPTPWAADKQYITTDNGPVPIATGHYTYVTDQNGRLHQEAVANAAFIVKTCNSHDALVKALEAVVRDVNEYERLNNLAPTPSHVECWDSVAHAKAVLARVGGARDV